MNYNNVFFYKAMENICRCFEYVLVKNYYIGNKEEEGRGINKTKGREWA